MKRFLLLALAFTFHFSLSAADAPLRVYIRSGPKTHGPGQHDHPRFLADWVPLLNSRGAKATGGNTFPTAAQLAETDVLIIHAQDGGNITGDDRTRLEAYLARGGGLVVIHAAAVSRDTDWYKSIVGGSWRQGTTKWLEAPMQLYFTDRDTPITRGVSNWGMDDEIYYDMDMSPDARVLATAYTPKAIDTGGRGNREAQARAAEAVAKRKGVNIYDIQPQMWIYERTIAGGTKPYRAFVSIPGHLYENFNRPNYRAILLRGIAWAGQRANADELCRPDELGDALRYPEGGPTAPAKAAAKLEVHPEFTVSLVASEPLINKVMGLDWDERGRLWVCETPEYPNGRRVPNTSAWKDSGSLRGAKVDRDPEDRISILTDTNGDGIMDTKHVFADKLELVTSFVFYKNGVIAATSPDIWYLEDTDGDGVCDKRTKLYTGLGINDTHAVINNLRWGLDGWIYATHGYSRGDVKSGDGTKDFGPDGSGVVRFKPDGSAFENFSSRGGNTWGLDITWDGQVFWTQPTSGTVFFHTVLPESVLAKAKLSGVTSWKGMIVNQKTYPLMSWPEQAYVQIDQVGNFTAAAGCAIYEGGAWPAKWNYSYFTTEPTLNLVHHEFVRPEGVSYSVAKEPGREETEFIRSRDMWFRPIETRVGPDGALYIVDFYNQAVIHNDTRGPQHSPANAAVRPDRDHYFSRLWKVQHKDAKKLEVPVLDRKNLAALIRTIETSPNAHVKQTAWRLAQENFAGDSRLVKLAKPMGSAALAKYEAARAENTPAAREKLLNDFAAATDDWTRSALAAAASEHAADYVLDALRSPRAAKLVDFVAAVLPSVGQSDAERVFKACGSLDSNVAVARVVLRGLASITNEFTSAPVELAQANAALCVNPETLPAAILVIFKWDRTGACRGLIASVGTSMLHSLKQLSLSNAEREAIRRNPPLDGGGPYSISDAQGVEFASSLLAIPQFRADALFQVAMLLHDGSVPSPLKTQLAIALGEAGGSDAVALVIDAFVRTRSAPLLEQILKRPESAHALLGALKEGRIVYADLGPANAARLHTHPNRTVAREAADVLAKFEQQAKAKDEVIAKLLPEVEKPGDAAKGRALFAGTCAICHRLGDLGTRDVGTPLAGIGSHPVAELLTSIVDPNRVVEPNYWQWNATTKKGETFTGVIARETPAGLTLRNQGGDFDLKAEDIATRENTRRSLMPEGFENLGAENLRDVIAFLRASAATPAAVVAATQAPAAAPAPAVANPKEGGRGDAPLPPLEPAKWEPGKTRVLIITGGSSHKFHEFFAGTDSATLRAAGYTVHATEDRDQATELLPQADIAVVSVNRKFFDTPEYRKALFAFAAAGKGLVMLHPGTWYGFPEWPELNAQIVGGGARGHDRLGKYSVNALKPDHPIMQGVPATFEVEDELYYINAEPDKIPAGTASIDVLAETSPSIRFKKPHPVVWITKHDKARIVGLTLGHDERVHDMAAYKALLTNAVKWVSGK